MALMVRVAYTHHVGARMVFSRLWLFSTSLPTVLLVVYYIFLYPEQRNKYTMLILCTKKVCLNEMVTNWLSDWSSYVQMKPIGKC